MGGSYKSLADGLLSRCSWIWIISRRRLIVFVGFGAVDQVP